MLNPLPDIFFKSPIALDWDLLASIDPSDLLLSHDKTTINLIIRDFLKTSSFDSQPPQTLAQLLRILQVIVKSLIGSNKKKSKKLDYQIRKNEKLHMKLKSVKKTPCNIVGVQCPICHKMFVSMKFVDVHIFSHHSELSAIWQSLRMPHYSGLTQTADPFTTEIKLKQTIDSLGDQLLLDQKNREMQIQHYFRKKLLKVNNKIDQISENEIPTIQSEQNKGFIKNEEPNIFEISEDYLDDSNSYSGNNESNESITNNDINNDIYNNNSSGSNTIKSKRKSEGD